MNKSTFDCTVQVFGNENTTHIEIPKTLSVAEVLNYLQFSQKLQFPKGSFILVKKAQYSYSIPNPQRDLTSYQNRHLIIILSKQPPFPRDIPDRDKGKPEIDDSGEVKVYLVIANNQYNPAIRLSIWIINNTLL